MGEAVRLFEVPPVQRQPGPIESAVLEGDDVEAVNAVLAKCARIMDESESGRDVKALSLTILDGIMKRRELEGTTPEAREAEERSTPLGAIRERYGRRVS